MKKDIAFIIYYPYQFYVYKNIYKHLIDRSIFIIDLYNFSENDEIDTFGSIKKLLEKNNIEYKIIRKEDYLVNTKVEYFFKDIKVMISVWWRGCMCLPETYDIFKIYSSYGVGKELLKVAADLSKFDLILSYGKSSSKYYSLFAKTVMIGNAKFDDFYENNLDYSLVDGLKLEKNKKNILYLPTHSNLGSFKKVMPELIKLSNKYNIIVKIHYFIEREESGFISKLNLSKIHFLKDDADLLPLLKVCDLSISDNSSVIFDVIQANKSLLLEDIWDEEYFETGIQKIGQAKRGLTGSLTYPDSIEQRIKREGLVALNKDVKFLGKDIEYALDSEEKYSIYRKEIVKDTVEYADANCGKRGAEAILALLSKEIEPRKGIMYFRDKKEDIFEVILGTKKLLTGIDTKVEVNNLCYVIFCEDKNKSTASIDSLISLEIEKSNIIMISEQEININGIISIKELKEENLPKGKKVLILRSGVVVDRLGLSSIIKDGFSSDSICLSVKTKRKYSVTENIFVNLKLPFLKSLVKSGAYFKSDTFYSFFGFIPEEFNSCLIGDKLFSQVLSTGKVIKDYDQIIFLVNTIPNKLKIIKLNIFSDLNFTEENLSFLKKQSLERAKQSGYGLFYFFNDVFSDFFTRKRKYVYHRIKIFWYVNIYRFYLLSLYSKYKIEKELIKTE